MTRYFITKNKKKSMKKRHFLKGLIVALAVAALIQFWVAVVKIRQIEDPLSNRPKIAFPQKPSFHSRPHPFHIQKRISLESNNKEIPEIFIGGRPVYKETIRPKNLTLHLVGERHSGTNWITDHLQKCFGNVQPQFSRWKHWFQDDIPGESQRVVIAQFRNPYGWISAMHRYSHHAPRHLELPWQKFVSLPWTMERFGLDLEWGNLSLYDKATMDPDDAPCQWKYFPQEIVPCLCFEEVLFSEGLRRPQKVHPFYELNRDGSGKPYNSILEFRTDKVRNMINMTNFENIHHFVPVQYEGLTARGTEPLIRHLEKVLGKKANCTPTQGKSRPKRRNPAVVEYLNQHLDWETEKLVGYKQIDPKDPVF